MSNRGTRAAALALDVRTVHGRATRTAAAVRIRERG
ncbi:hypothetical protein QFZ79_003367 [Arthrobacter sp. V4I6]|nr:hypothetical protein [Arthrobacter sp. V1I7]MDQ0855256.1 hypothetical protein [Arthrobacter sp. V4I6]